MEQADHKATGMLRQTALLTCASAASFGLSFLLPLVLARTLSQTEFGLYKQAFQIVATLVTLLNLQMAASGTYFIAREPERRAQIALNVMLWYLLAGAVTALVFLCWPQCVTLLVQGRELIPHVPLLGLAVLTGLFAINLDVLLLAVRDYRAVSVSVVAAQLARLLLMLTAALYFRTLTALLLAVIIHGLLHSAVMLHYLRRHFGSLLAPFDRRLFRAQLANALPFGLGGIAGSLIGDLPHYFVAYYFDAAAFAIYAVGCFQMPLGRLLVGSFSSVIEPEAARLVQAGDKAQLIQVWFRTTRHLSLLLAPLCALLFVVRHEFISLLFTRNYAAAVPLFAISLLGVLLFVSRHLNILRAFNEHRYYRLKLYLVLLPVNWLALQTGRHFGGLRGVVAAVVAAQALDVLCSIVPVAKALQVRASDLRQLAPMLRVLIVTLAAALMAAASRHVVQAQPELWRLLTAGGVFGLIYLPGILCSGALTEAERHEIRLIVRRAGRVARWRRLAAEGA